MNAGPAPLRALAVACVAAAVLLAPLVAPRVGLGQAPGAAPAGPQASPNDLLSAQPFDRITLTDGATLNVEPISPRPLPPYDPKKDDTAEPASAKKGKRAAPPPEGNVFLPGKEPKKDPEQINEINVHIVGAEQGDFKVRRLHIKDVEYFEDLLIAAGRRLVLAREYDRAFEHYLRVRQRAPEWKGLREAVDDLLAEEGSAAILLQNDPDRGLRLLRELFDRRPDYPGLVDRLAKGYAAQVEEAFGKGQFRRGRQVLHELEVVARDHELAVRWREKYAERAGALVRRAESAGDDAERLDRLAEAVRIWPALAGLAEKYESAFRALPTLDVAVADLPRPFVPAVRSPADDRARRLAYLPVVARGGDEESPDHAASAPRPDQLAESIQAADIGRRWTIRLRPGVAWSDGSRAVGARDVARALEDRALAGSPNFQARWADLLERVEVAGPHELELRLSRAPLRPADWLVLPVGPADASADGLVTGNDGRRRAVGDGPFLPAGADKSIATHRAARAVAEGGAKIRRLREVRLPNRGEALAALLRGEVALVDRVDPDRVAALGKADGIQIGRHEQVSLHRIALDGRNPALRNRTLRRGLSYAIDRKALLEGTLLRRPGDAEDAPSDGPFARGSYADAPDVRPLDYDPLLARLLVAAARKEMGGAPIKLTFEYPASPAAQLVAPKIAASLRAAGVEINAVERPETPLEEELRSGRKFDLAYRAGRCAEPAHDAGPLICPGYDAPPSADGLGAIASPRTLQVLLQLERAQDWPTARGLIVRLDRESRDELPVLPLWQVVEHYAWRPDILKGPADTAEALYDNVSAWEVEPWIVRDPWSP